MCSTTNSSPYIANSARVTATFMVHSFHQEAQECTHVLYTTKLAACDDSTARGAHCLLNSLLKLAHYYNKGYFPNVAVFLTPKFLNYYFGIITNTDRTQSYICEVSERCNGENDGMTREECISKLRKLPILTNGSYFAGNSYGCRVLHAAFADTNKNHCPHISFEPLEDSKGNVKRQTSSNIQTSDIFDALIFKDYVSVLWWVCYLFQLLSSDMQYRNSFHSISQYNWMNSPDSLTETIDGCKILSLSTEKINIFRVLVGCIAPACVGLLVLRAPI